MVAIVAGLVAARWRSAPSSPASPASTAAIPVDQRRRSLAGSPVAIAALGTALALVVLAVGDRACCRVTGCVSASALLLLTVAAELVVDGIGDGSSDASAIAFGCFIALTGAALAAIVAVMLRQPAGLALRDPHSHELVVHHRLPADGDHGRHAVTIVLLLLVSVAGRLRHRVRALARRPTGARAPQPPGRRSRSGSSRCSRLPAPAHRRAPWRAIPSLRAGCAWGGALLPGSYLRLVVALAAVDGRRWSTAIAWLLGGLPAIDRACSRPCSPRSAGTTVSLAAADPVVGSLGAAGTGLVAVPLILAGTRPGRTLPALRELRASIITAGLVASGPRSPARS